MKSVRKHPNAVMARTNNAEMATGQHPRIRAGTSTRGIGFMNRSKERKMITVKGRGHAIQH